MADARPRFPFARPAVPAPAQWLPYLQASYDERWFSNGGPCARQLEGRLAMHVGDGRSVALTSSATAGITAVLLALDVRGRVATPAFTFPATAHAIEAAGCEPWFCDVDPDTWELDPHAVARAIADDGCGAVVHVRTFGSARDLTALEGVCADADVPLVIDAASSFGARTPDAAPVGRAGIAEVFSFHATKPFCIGEGGAVACAPTLASTLALARNFGLRDSMVVTRGTNAKLAEPLAAIGLAMLDEFDEHLAARRSAGEQLVATLDEHGVGSFPAGSGSLGYQGVPLALPDGMDRDAVVARLGARGVEARTYYCPGLHRHPVWAAANAGRSLPATDALAARVLCVPVYADLTVDELGQLDDALRWALSDRPSG